MSTGNGWYRYCLGTKELRADHTKQRHQLETKLWALSRSELIRQDPGYKELEYQQIIRTGPPS